MKIKNQTLDDNYTSPFELPRPDGRSIVLTLRPLPLGFYHRLRKRGIVPPAPPTRVARDSQGKPLKDQQGLALLVADEYDENYLLEVELYHQRVAVLVAAEALQSDPNVEFDTSAPEGDKNWTAYADYLYQEFEQAGFSAGDLIQLCEEVCRLSNLFDGHLQQAQKNFSQRGRGTIS